MYQIHPNKDICSNMKDVMLDSQQMKNTNKCCHGIFEELGNMRNLTIMLVKKRIFGWGRKSKAVEVPEDVFQWFTDVWTNLNLKGA